MSVSLLSIDLAKNIFQLYGVDERGHPVLSRRVSRSKLLEVVVALPCCRIVMEACGGAHYWARRFSAMGHHVQIIAPRFVKPFVKSQKNDRNDAEAIVEAASRPTMRYVAVNSVEQQDIQSMHRVRSLLMRDRIAQINQIRGLLAEYGVVIAQTPLKIRTQLPAIIDDECNELTGLTRSMMRDMYERLVLLDKQIARYDELIHHVHRASPASQRLEKIRGVGPMIATAVIAAAGSASEFSNGRQFAAWLGLTPRQHSSGGKDLLFGITKRGNGYLRMLLVHGARSVVQQAVKHTDALSRWILEVQARRGTNIAVVALANKIARTIWVLLARGVEYVSPV
ncbi:IS110 family transposase [Paraburkholderia caribensis]|uniref:Transposase IS116/IS110/IS902 family protein n=2 Tax=Paraburkholderia TaxID=1822464 RepID=B2JXN5_PARP8|nr:MULTISPECIES: IS110 family transposase [Paraburkholderia]ACC76393.1 transposase IS116/IS110/IS902 family protein [Paraburkholderia phymatum STM815]MCO4882894.1 IS110 family transposase [Paraburkholderia caribensis]PTB24615.1 IS110 family transposase [Paraburkholderia caribensis]